MSSQPDEGADHDHITAYPLVSDEEKFYHDFVGTILSGGLQAGEGVVHAGILGVRSIRDRRLLRMYAGDERVGTLNLRAIDSGVALAQAFEWYSLKAAETVDRDEIPEEIASREHHR